MSLLQMILCVWEPMRMGVYYHNIHIYMIINLYKYMYICFSADDSANMEVYYHLKYIQ